MSTIYKSREDILNPNIKFLDTDFIFNLCNDLRSSALTKKPHYSGLYSSNEIYGWEFINNIHLDDKELMNDYMYMGTNSHFHYFKHHLTRNYIYFENKLQG